MGVQNQPRSQGPAVAIFVFLMLAALAVGILIVLVGGFVFAKRVEVQSAQAMQRAEMSRMMAEKQLRAHNALREKLESTIAEQPQWQIQLDEAAEKISLTIDAEGQVQHNEQPVELTALLKEYQPQISAGHPPHITFVVHSDCPISEFVPLYDKCLQAGVQDLVIKTGPGDAE